MSLLKQNIQIPPPLSTNWHPSFFFRVSKFFWGAKRGVPPKNFNFFLLLSHDNRLTWIYSIFTASCDDYSFQNLTKKMPEGILAPPWIGLRDRDKIYSALVFCKSCKINELGKLDRYLGPTGNSSNARSRNVMYKLIIKSLIHRLFQVIMLIVWGTNIK